MKLDFLEKYFKNQNTAVISGISVWSEVQVILQWQQMISVRNEIMSEASVTTEMLIH
jgi:hypothetical protein